MANMLRERFEERINNYFRVELNDPEFSVAPSLCDELLTAVCKERGCLPQWVPAEKSELDRRQGIISKPLVAGTCIHCGKEAQ